MNNGTVSTEAFDWKKSCKVMGFYRRSLNVSQRELAVLVGVTHVIIGCWERGIKEPKISNFVKLARALGISELELMYPSDELKKKMKEEEINIGVKEH